jgi:hypothetical protein
MKNVKSEFKSTGGTGVRLEQRHCCSRSARLGVHLLCYDLLEHGCRAEPKLSSTVRRLPMRPSDLSTRYTGQAR